MITCAWRIEQSIVFDNQSIFLLLYNFNLFYDSRKMAAENVAGNKFYRKAV